MKVVNKIRIKVPFSSSEEADAPRDEHFIAVIKPIRMSDAKRQQDEVINYAKAVHARQALEADAAAKGIELEKFDLATPYNYLTDKLLCIEGLEGADDQGGDLADPLIAKAYVLDDIRMLAALQIAVTNNARALKTGN